MFHDLPVHMSVTPHKDSDHMTEEGFRFTGIGFRDDCDVRV